MHGFYVSNQERHEDYVLIVPYGRRQEINSPLNTRIDLPLTGAPACRLAIGGRCLLEFQYYIDYPSVGGKTDGSGEVTVTGRIRRDGVPSDLAAVDAKADPPEWRSVFADRSIRNLSTWRFEPSTREDDIRITYNFDVSVSASPDGTDVLFRLPDDVRIRRGRTR